MNFRTLDISKYIYNLFQVFTKKQFKGWGRKKTGRFAAWCHKKFGGTLMLQEDGFIRSIGLGVDGFPSFSLIEDDIGIYYDATAPSRLENILNTYDFQNDVKLMENARQAISLIKKHHVSKYNMLGRDQDCFVVPPRNDEKVGCFVVPPRNDEKVECFVVPPRNDGKMNCFAAFHRHCEQSEAISSNILIIAQTEGDASLEYGMLDSLTTDDMIAAALSENPNARVFLKMHPDVLSGKKKSDITIENLPKSVCVLTENINSISLLKHFDKVYTKTSGMGFEALIVGCECVCFGMPFYAGWGVTIDKSTCHRRKQKRTVEEIFAAAYILYTRYVNPSTKQECTIFDVIEEIVARRDARYKSCR
jgi:capsule polysaccharide export protein KpsC/LpsZ